MTKSENLLEGWNSQGGDRPLDPRASSFRVCFELRKAKHVVWGLLPSLSIWVSSGDD